MVPKADSGAFLLLFLLVLTVTEPLRPGARGGGAGRAAGRGRGTQGRGRPGPSSRWWGRVPGGRLLRPILPGTAPRRDRAVSLPGGLERLVHGETLFSRAAAFARSTSVEPPRALRLMEARVMEFFLAEKLRLELGWGSVQRAARGGS